jgi:hypothetical protein
LCLATTSNSRESNTALAPSPAHDASHEAGRGAGLVFDGNPAYCFTCDAVAFYTVDDGAQRVVLVLQRDTDGHPAASDASGS